MPNRIIRDGWLESEPINSLDAYAERFYLRLCLRADDFGRFHANPSLLKNLLFPLKDDVRGTDIPRWLAACEKAGLLRCYIADARPYVEIQKFRQRTRADKSKFPAPPTDDGQLTVICQTDDGQPRTETKSNANAKSETIVGPSGKPAALSDSEWIASLKENPAYTGLDVDREIARARTWAENKRRKCSRAFIINWLNRAEVPIGQPTTKPKPSLPECQGWKGILNHSFPESIYSAGQAEEVHEWTKLPRHVQELIWKTYKNGNQNP